MGLVEDSTGASRRKRAYHRKVRTGCLTCKIRKVRCDEEKPSCHRCTSTGRKCDGYAETPDAADHSTSSASPPTSSALVSRSFRPVDPSLACLHDPARDQKLALPRRCPGEIRSYRYFLDVAAPSLAGIFDTEFWLAEIPRSCHADPAIWHAVVSLGAAYESHAGRSLSTSPQKVFALQQFGLSVRALMEQSSKQPDTWRALTVSVIFTCVCAVQGLHSQARMHLKSGRRLLLDLQQHGDALQEKVSSRLHPLPLPHQPQLPRSPVSLAPLKAILINLEIQAAAKDNGGLVRSAALLAENDMFNFWRFYEAPSEATESPRVAKPLTIDTIMQARRAAESLFSGLVYLRQRLMGQSPDVAKSIGPEQVGEFIAHEAPHVRCFKQVRKAHRLLSSEAATSSAFPLDALLALSLSIATTRLLFVEDPEMPDPVKRAENLPQQYKDIVDLAERILESDAGPGWTYAPSATVSSALLTVAHSGFPQSLRRRAVRLMTRYPRREGLSSSLETVSFANAIMDREQELLRGKLSANGLPDDDNDVEVPPLTRIFNSTFKYIGDRSALLVLRTWGEFLEGRPGQEQVIYW